MKLFVVVERSTGEVDSYYASRAYAKTVRDGLPGGAGRWKVSRGPDHWKGSQYE